MQILFSFLNFLVIQNFSGLATILTIGGAIYLYLKSKRENKQQIATLLINDIRNANTAIEAIKDAFNNPTNKFIPDITVLSENNWKKFSYLFSRDFDEDEMRNMNKYFNNIERISYLVNQHSNLFLLQISSRMAALQGTNINLLSSAASERQAKENIAELDRRFANNDISTSPYEPNLFYYNLEKYLPEIPSILMTLAGKKLKQIANPPKSKLRFWTYLL